MTWIWSAAAMCSQTTTVSLVSLAIHYGSIHLICVCRGKYLPCKPAAIYLDHHGFEARKLNFPCNLWAELSVCSSWWDTHLYQALPVDRASEWDTRMVFGWTIVTRRLEDYYNWAKQILLGVSSSAVLSSAPRTPPRPPPWTAPPPPPY